MNATTYILVAILLVGVQAGYLQLARQFGIVDRPNDRSLHTDSTIIRGGGILFFVAEFVAFFYSGFAYPYFFAGLTVVAAVSFGDDLRPLPRRYRLGVQFAGVALLLYQTELITDEIMLIAGLLILGVGILNAWNFMDGINGMTAWYSLVCIGTLWFWQGKLYPGDDATGFLPFAFMALLFFSFVNARRRAVCFAGDVGSVSIAFVSLFPLVQLIISLQTYLPVLLLAVYGVDTVLTLIHRLYRRENIFRAHRQHLFQLLVFKKNWPHLRVSGLYALVQLAVNLLVMSAVGWESRFQWLLAIGILATLAMGYMVVKRPLTNE